MIIILAVLAPIVVKSPWPKVRGVFFTVCSTEPIALFMGIYMRFIRPGRVKSLSLVRAAGCPIYFGGVGLFSRSVLGSGTDL